MNVGANDGIRDSISYFFEKNLNWSGILVEPQTDLMNQCKLNRSQLNIFINNGLGNEEGLFEFIIPTDNLDNASFNLSKEHINQLRKDGYGKSFRTEIIEIITYQNIIEQYGIKNIDLCILDVEGFENKILKNLIRSDVLPEVLVVEHDWSNLNELNKIVKKKYDIYRKFDHDIVYIRKK